MKTFLQEGTGRVILEISLQEAQHIAYGIQENLDRIGWPAGELLALLPPGEPLDFNSGARWRHEWAGPEAYGRSRSEGGVPMP